MKDIELIATDLDGTLVHDRRIAPVDRRALIDVIRKRIPVMPATTRMRFSASHLCSGLPIFDNPIVCLNGARVVGPGWDDHEDHINWLEKSLDQKIAKSIARFADKKGYELTTVFNERKFWKRRSQQRLGRNEEDPVAFLVENNQDALDHGEPVSFMMHREENGSEGLEKVEKFVKKRFPEKTILHRHHRMGEWIALTIYPEKTSKLDALKVACNKLNIPLERTMAIGDDEVDEEMLKEAGLGIAMGNSPEHIKDIADDVAPSCTEGGFAWVMRKYILD